MSKFAIKASTQFKKDAKLMKKRGFDMSLLKDVIDRLAAGDELPERYRAHSLQGSFKGFDECHITPDWLLVYKRDKGILVLVLTRTGTHSDLFR